jgi:hypothetical protein
MQNDNTKNPEKQTDGNDSAFPAPNNASLVKPEYGLTKREYFASSAMQGLLARGGLQESFNLEASAAVDAAAALEAALNKKEGA